MARQSPSSEISSDLFQRVVNTIHRYDMFSHGDRVLIGVSGGPDSMALLNIMITLAPRLGLYLAVAHLNHGLRAKASDQDAAFVRQAVGQLNLPYHEEKAQVIKENGSAEEQAREIRYAFFKRVMETCGYTTLALGHQKNDNAEAVLMHLLRGSGIRGLGGIPPVRDQWVVRPLIDIGRSEILTWLNQESIAYVEDASNLDPTYEHNRIRHQLIPLLVEAYNPNIVDVLHRTAGLCREEDAWLTHHLQPTLQDAVTRSDKDHLQIQVTAVAAAPLAVQRRLIREALAQWHGHLRRMTVNHIDNLIRLLPEAATGKRVSLPFCIEAERRVRDLYFTCKKVNRIKTVAAPFTYYYKIPDEADFPLAIDVPEAGCRLAFEIHGADHPFASQLGNENVALFDLDLLMRPFAVRNFRPGDRITPFGLQGTQKIKKIFIDRKIPADQRIKIPLFESAGEIVWIAGVRRSNRAPITKKSRHILEVRRQWSPKSGTGSEDQHP